MLHVLSIRNDLFQQFIEVGRDAGEAVKFAFFGGLCSNYLALEVAISDALTRNVD